MCSPLAITQDLEPLNRMALDPHWSVDNVYFNFTIFMDLFLPFSLLSWCSLTLSQVQPYVQNVFFKITFDAELRVISLISIIPEKEASFSLLPDISTHCFKAQFKYHLFYEFHSDTSSLS